MSAYTYMLDHIGNVVGLVDSATGQAERQVFDAFGVNVGGYITFRWALDSDYTDDPWHLYCGSSQVLSCCPQDVCEDQPRGLGDAAVPAAG